MSSFDSILIGVSGRVLAFPNLKNPSIKFFCLSSVFLYSRVHSFNRGYLANMGGGAFATALCSKFAQPYHENKTALNKENIETFPKRESFG